MSKHVVTIIYVVNCHNRACLANATMPKQKPAEGPVAYTLSVIGSSWTCLILRDLLQHGATRSQDLQDSLHGIAPTTLSERLRTLEQNGVVERRVYLFCVPSRAR